VAKRSRSSLPATRLALELLGGQVAEARRERGWTAAELAERLGVNVQLVARIERGDPGCAVGTVLEAAVLSGVALFDVEPDALPAAVELQRARLALLPKRIRPKPAVAVDDDF